MFFGPKLNHEDKIPWQIHHNFIKKKRKAGFNIKISNAEIHFHPSTKIFTSVPDRSPATSMNEAVPIPVSRLAGSYRQRGRYRLDQARTQDSGTCGVSQDCVVRYSTRLKLPVFTTDACNWYRIWKRYIFIKLEKKNSLIIIHFFFNVVKELREVTAKTIPMMDIGKFCSYKSIFLKILIWYDL